MKCAAFCASSALGAVRKSRIFGVSAIACTLLTASWTPASAGENNRPDGYLLNISDKISIKVGRWKAIEADFEEWKGLSREIFIDSSGAISVGIIGRMEAAGRTAEDVARELSIRLQRQIGLADPPATTIEVVEYVPIYVVGAVSKPGEHRF